MDGLVIARTLHILAIVIWIGGLAMATTVALPAIRRGELGADPLKAFHAIERRFIWQARASVLLVGLSGLYMIAELDLWDRFEAAEFWWMHAMVGVWLVFALILFVAEPFILHRYFLAWASRAPVRAFAWLHRVHVALLICALVTVCAAAAGSHGWLIF